MGLDSGSVLQINATVIAGILVLLTISSFAEQAHSDRIKLDTEINKFKNISAIVIIIPFALSAVLTLYGRFHKIIHLTRYSLYIHRKHTESLHDLQMKLKGSQSVLEDSVIQEQIEQLEKKYEKERSDLMLSHEFDNPSPFSIICMIVGFGLIVALLSAMSILTLYE